MTTALALLAPVGLETVAENADLQTRVDRKYVVSPSVVDHLVAELLMSSRVLTIDGLSSFRYESVYFDTPDLQSYRAAAHGRRRRFKVRSRTYLDSSRCALEVKTVGGRDETIKNRLEQDAAERARLNDDARRFVRDCLGGGVPVDELAPTLTTTYRRSTVIDERSTMRVTFDKELVCAAADGSTCALGELVVVETKSPGAATAVDHWMWSEGVRPARVSKYCVGLAVLDPELSANRWARTLSRYF